MSVAELSIAATLPPPPDTRRIAGGFLRLDSSAILEAWHSCHSSPRLGTGAFRVWLATIEVRHRRMSRATRCQGWDGRSIDPDEVAKLCGISRRRVVGLLGRMAEAGLEVGKNKTNADSAFVLLGGQSSLDILSRGGPVALPRRLVRWLLRSRASRATIATALGSVLRCVSYRRGSFDGRGRIKSSWVAGTFGIDLRGVKAARTRLVSLGWLAPQPSGQRIENRHGRAFAVNLDWQPPRAGLPPLWTAKERTIDTPSVDLSPPSREIEEPEPCGETGFYQNQDQGPPTPTPDPLATQLAARPAEITTARPTAPAMATATTPPRSSSSAESKAPAPTTDLPPANLDDIRVGDLRDVGLLLELHRQATQRGLIGSSQAERLRFIASAVHCLAIGSNPPAMFAATIRGGWWRHATQGDEDEARRMLKDHAKVENPPFNPVAIALPNPPDCQISLPKRATTFVPDARMGTDGMPITAPVALSELLARKFNRFSSEF